MAKLSALEEKKTAISQDWWHKKENLHINVTGYGKTDHFAHYFKIELLVFRGSVDLKQ